MVGSTAHDDDLDGHAGIGRPGDFSPGGDQPADREHIRGFVHVLGVPELHRAVAGFRALVIRRYRAAVSAIGPAAAT